MDTDRSVNAGQKGKIVLEGEDRLREILYSMQIGIVVIDELTHRILDVNEKAAEMIGAPKNQFLGSLCHQYICPAEKGHCPITDLGKTVDNAERVLLRASGEKMPIIKTVVRSGLNGRNCLIESFIDITERKKMEEVLKNSYFEMERKFEERAVELRAANEKLQKEIIERIKAEETLRESEKKYRQVIENATEIIYTTDSRGNFTYANPAALKTTGFPLGELQRLNYLDLIVPEHRERVKEVYVKQWRERHGTTYVEFPFFAKSGKVLWFGQNASLVVEGFNVAGFHIIARDITERKKAEKELAALQEQFLQAQKMEAIGHLAGGVAHDFNNLLTVIRGYTDLLLNALGEENPLYPDAEEIKNASIKAETLTRQLLAFSRRQVLQPKVLNLNDLLANMGKMIGRLIGEDVRLVTLLAENLGQVKADPGQIEQVIINLAVNARDAMPGGGKITIETANVELDKTYPSSHIGATAGPYVMLSVSDTGVGMTPDVQERIFEPFFTTKEKGKGTGLGLSTVYGIVNQSGGNIYVYSKPGRGTTFKVYLPRIDEAAEATNSEDTIPQSVQGSETILVVEDEKVVRKVVSSILQKKGYKVMAAASGEEALSLAQRQDKNSIQLVLTDVVMSGMNGVELAKQLTLRHPEAKVVFMSGYAGKAVILHEILHPGMPYIQKPFTPEALARKIRKVLDKK